MNNETLKRDLCARLNETPLFECIDLESNEFEVLPMGSIDLSNGDFIISIGNMEIPIDEIGNGKETGLSIKPYLFPTSALTKEIQLVNYNNGEPFVPLVEIARLCANKDFGVKTDTPLYFDENQVSYIHQDVRYEFIFDGVSFSYDWKGRVWNKCSVNQLLGFELLHKFHINYRLSPDQFIEVSEENNPYK